MGKVDTMWRLYMLTFLRVFIPKYLFLESIRWRTKKSKYILSRKYTPCTRPQLFLKREKYGRFLYDFVISMDSLRVIHVTILRHVFVASNSGRPLLRCADIMLTGHN